MSYEAEIPALTLQTASLAESVMNVWAGQHPSSGCPWEGTRVNTLELLMSFLLEQPLLPRGLSRELCVPQAPSIPTLF